jgi:hypothetical protein
MSLGIVLEAVWRVWTLRDPQKKLPDR